MPKGQKHDEQDKKDAVAQFKGLGGGVDAAKQVAADYFVSPSTIKKWARTNSKRAKPKRKVKRAVKAKPTDADWKKAFYEFILHRDKANEALKKAEAARKKLEQIIRELK